MKEKEMSSIKKKERKSLKSKKKKKEIIWIKEKEMKNIKERKKEWKKKNCTILYVHVRQSWWPSHWAVNIQNSTGY